MTAQRSVGSRPASCEVDDRVVPHPIPAEIGLRGGRAALLRPRVEPAAWLAEQPLPDW